MNFRAAWGLAAALTVSSAAATGPQPPPGWKMELVAAAPTLRHPSVVCCAPDGRVFVAEDPMDISSAHPDSAEGRILCFRPDGTHTVFAEHLHAVFGMQYLEGNLYVLHNPQFSVFRDIPGAGGERVDLIQSMNPNPWALDWNDHIPANFKLAMDGYFYVATGDKGVYGAVGRDGQRFDMHSGGVFRMRPDGSRLEIYSTGARNILDVVLNDEDEIFTYDNTDEHDWMGRFSHMVDGGFYGYPYDFVPRRPYTLWMMHDFGGGAACDTLCYTEDALPDSYRENLFLADFGKRQVLRVRIERAADTYRVVDWEEFFPNPPDDFRPVGIAWGPDGRSMYICDWQHADTKEAVEVGRLWKASWTGPDRSSPKPSWYLDVAMGRPCMAMPQALIDALAHPSKNVRLLAQRRLSERKATAALTKLLQNPNAPAVARWHAIWALNAIDDGQAGRQGVLRALDDPDVRIRRQAIRQLGQNRALEARDALIASLKDPDASIRFQAATALGRIGARRSIPALLESLNDTNLFTRFAAFTALNRIGRGNASSWPLIVKGLESPSAPIREGTGFATRETYVMALVEALSGLAGRPAARPDSREAALGLLASLALRLPEWKGEWWAYHPALEPPPPKTVEWAGTAKIRAALAHALDDKDLKVRLTAVSGLRTAHGTNSTSQMRARFDSERNPEVRIALVTALGELKDPAFSPRLAQLLEEKPVDAKLLEAAIRAAGQLEGTELRVGLLKLVSAGTTSEPVRIEAISVLGQWGSKEALSILGPLLSTSSTALRLEAQRAVARIGGTEALRLLRALLAEPAFRKEAVAALSRLRDSAAVPDLLDAWKEPETHDAALAALAGISDSRCLAAYLEGLSSVNASLRERCLMALKPIRDEVLPSLESQVATIPPEVLRRLRGLYEDHPRAKAGPLFAAQLQLPQAADYELFAATHPGDALKGQRLFFDQQSVACIKCHAVAGYGGTVGPDLTLIGAQFPRATLVESVLYPSRVVREGYQQTVLELTDGESVSGLLKTESAGVLTLVDATANSHLVQKTGIARRQLSRLSLMPEGLEAGLTPEQFSDVIAFLESRRMDPRQPVNQPPPDGFELLFNGRDLGGWRELPEGTKRVAIGDGSPPQHWRALHGLLEHDGQGGDLWSKAEFGDFELRLEWRWVDPPSWADFPIIDPDGLERSDAHGRPATERVLDAGDSGILLRGWYKAQVNLFCYPVGSGEVWEYRTDPATSPEGRRALTPQKAADKPIGDWNQIAILLRGDRLTVVLNGAQVISAALLPGIPARGPIGFQHEHGRIQFRNVFILTSPDN